MTKLMALDLGDQWIGVAISDAARIVARPYKTVAISDLAEFLKQTLSKEDIWEVVVGYPRTMTGGESIQTKKILDHKDKLQSLFPKIKFIMWDERLSSQRAKTIGTLKTKEDKMRSHAIAAAFILDSYLSYLHNQLTNISQNS